MRVQVLAYIVMGDLLTVEVMVSPGDRDGVEPPLHFWGRTQGLRHSKADAGVRELIDEVGRRILELAGEDERPAPWV
jgi:hypothetical protein